MRKLAYIIFLPLCLITALLASITLRLGDWISDGAKIVALLFSTALLLGCSTPNRTIDTGYPGKVHYSISHAILPASLSAISGVCYGLHETSVHHPDRIPASWDRRFWDNRVSWHNKYRNGDPDLGPAYFGSTTFLAWTTDAKHLFGTLHRSTLFAAGITISIGDRRPAWHYLADAGLSFLCFSAGFHGVYTLALK